MDGVGLSGLTLQSDGKIITAGNADGDPDAAGDDGTERVFGIARFNPDGTIDQSFGIGGAVLRGFDVEIGAATGVAVRPSDGLIAVVGTDAGQDADLLVLNPDGTDARAANGFSRFGSRNPPSDGEAPTPPMSSSTRTAA